MAIDGGSPSAVEVHVSEAEAAAEERADRTACDLQARSRLAWQPNVFSRGDDLPVRVGLAFEIAPCGELWAKEFGGGAPMCAQHLPTKWSPTPLSC